MIEVVSSALRTWVRPMAAAILITAIGIGAADAQSEPARAADAKPIVDPLLMPASCCTSRPGSGAGGFSCYSGAGCVPGRNCDPGPCDSTFGRLMSGLYYGVCCPDPCYEPRWILEANAAFFQDSPRPVTQTRIRWDNGFNYLFPDSSEFFWAKEKTKGPANFTPSMKYSDLLLYQEIAAGSSASMFVEVSYRSFDAIGNPSGAGMGDMNVGAKAVLLDRELILITSQFRTFLPTGNYRTGLGTGHTSIEPALMAALKITPSTYLQTQIAEWIPLGGTPGFAGSVFHYHIALNQRLYQHGDFITVLANIELNGYTFRGQFSDAPLVPGGDPVVRDMAGQTYTTLGPGFRIMFCDRADLGVGLSFRLGNNSHGPESLYRTEFRWRF
ncbi:MAG: hypothetical protein FJ303_11340 [Planctomycetes bacterium]|nr:hypothetical protein [Planctomycetota bacterium]